jgi:arabinose-5-phosphate isomerase
VLIVQSDQFLQGIFTDGDLRRALQNHGVAALEQTMEELMTKTPRTIAPHELAVRALQVMEGDQKKPITVLPVVSEERKVVGLVKMHDIIQSGL